MGIFDIFNKKSVQNKQETPINENVLEIVLRKASTEPAYRAEFYSKLLSENLVILTDKTYLKEGTQILEKDTNVNIVSFNDGKIPVFTSTDKIFDKGVIKERVPFMEMKGVDLFNFTKGSTFILNPYSDYGKELLPTEIENILNGTILNSNQKKITVEKNTEVQIGQPAIYPTEIVNSLKILFATKPSVKKAYLGWIYNPTSNEPPHLIFALDIEGEAQLITNEAGYTANQFLKKEDIIDFIQITDKGGLCDYFTKQTKPFYIRQ